jgi:hypothetical protein
MAKAGSEGDQYLRRSLLGLYVAARSLWTPARYLHFEGLTNFVGL